MITVSSRIEGQKPSRLMLPPQLKIVGILETVHCVRNALCITQDLALSSALPDYSPASPGNTSSESLNNSYGLVPMASPTLSLFYDDLYMKVMHAYDAIILPQVPILPPIIVPPSLMLSPIFNPQEFFIHEELLPPKEQDCNFHAKPKPQPTPRNSVHRGYDKYAMRVSHQNSARMTHPHSNKNVVPTAVLTRSRLVSFNAARHVLTTVTQSAVKSPSPVKHVVNKAHSPTLKKSMEDMLHLKGILKVFCGMKGIKREFSVARTSQQNRVAERKNRTLIEAARTMLADSLLPIPFWAEAINTACYVQNRETLHINFLETKPNVAGIGTKWLFNIDTLTMSMNYQPVVAGNQPNDNAEFSFNSSNRVNAVSSPVNAVGPNPTNSTNSFNTASPSIIVVSPNFGIAGKSLFMDPSKYPDADIPELEDIVYSYDKEDVGA
nr:ribonuclease H-like domain-containing protein [Tanacetum cinerariifolium]